MTETPWEPPLAGTEVEHLLGALNRLRTTFRWKADGLDAEGLSARVGASALTLGGLLAHLAFVEDHMSTVRLSGQPMGEPWASLVGGRETDDGPGPDAGDDGGDPTFSLGNLLAPEDLYALWDGAAERARARVTAALERGGPEQLVALSMPDGRHASLRRVLFDVVEEYGRHTGHADLLRESVDGRVGEDPPPGWAPVSGRGA